MNLVYGEIVAVGAEDGLSVGRVRVGGALRQANLDLLPSAEPGDRVLLCDGVALSKVEDEPSNPIENHVPRHSR